MEKHATVFQAACAEVIARCCAMRKINIMTDNQATNKAIMIPITRWKLYREALDKLAQYNKLSLIWIAGHKSTKGNMVVNPLTKEDSRGNLIGPEPTCEITFDSG
ncbi:hypothetical protein Trydic_g20320 [Trypoxylus dichotomus]